MRAEFLHWLHYDKRRCPTLDELAASTASNNPDLCPMLNESAAVVAALDSGPSRGSLHPPALSGVGLAGVAAANPRAAVDRVRYVRIQQSMLQDALQAKSSLLRELDPSRNPGAEELYREVRKWFKAGDERVRFSHADISPA